MKSIEFNIEAVARNERVTEVKIEAINNFTGEVYYVKGYARCSSQDRFDKEKGVLLAKTRAVKKALEKILKQHKVFIVKPFREDINEKYYRKTLNEILTIQEELIATKLYLAQLLGMF